MMIKNLSTFIYTNGFYTINMVLKFVYPPPLIWMTTYEIYHDHLDDVLKDWFLIFKLYCACMSLLLKFPVMHKWITCCSNLHPPFIKNEPVHKECVYSKRVTKHGRVGIFVFEISIIIKYINLFCISWKNQTYYMQRKLSLQSLPY